MPDSAFTSSRFGVQRSPLPVSQASATHSRKLKVLIYTEATPLAPDVVTHGLHRALGPILNSIRDEIEIIAIYPVSDWYPWHDIDLKLRPLCRRLGPWWTKITKLCNRFPFLNPLLNYSLPARVLAQKLQRVDADIILSFVGTDFGTMVRTASFARHLHLPYAFYIVDDFVLPLRLSGQVGRAAVAAAKAQDILHRADHIFTITSGLGDLLKNYYGVTSSTLHLAFDIMPRPVVPVKLQIIYLGSINFLYAEGLKILFDTVQRIRTEANIDLTIRLTARPELARRELGRLPSFVSASPIEGAQHLAEEIAGSLFAYLPYSFDVQHREMITTSFPSKTMEYLAFSRSIVVYGPEYGTSIRYFREMNLPTVCSSPEALEVTIHKHIITQPDYSTSYVQTLKKNHSSDAVRNILLSTFGQKVAPADEIDGSCRR